MTEAGELFATIGGRDVGLSAILQKVEAEMQHGADSAVRLGQQYARLAQAQGQPALAGQVLAGTMERAGTASERAIIGIETQAARLANSKTYFDQLGESAQSSLLGIVGPAAAVGTALTAVQGVANSFVEAFNFKAQLDQTTASIRVQLQGVRDSGQVFSEASGFANRYKFTQEQTNEAIQAALPILRQSKSGTEDILGVFARLQVLKPEKTFGDAARALGELNAGQITSIVDQFNISRTAANKMKDEIAGGADAVQVLSKYLDGAGIGMDSLAVRAQGAAGKMNELAVAEEKLKVAEAGQAGGLGLTILQTKINFTNALTNALSGNANALYAAAKAQDSAYNNALAKGASEQEAARAGDAARIAVLSRFTDAASQAAVAEYQRAQGTLQGTAAAQQSALTMDNERQAAAALTQARQADIQSTIEDIAKKQESTLASQQLAAMQQTLAGLGSLVASGLLTSGNAALQLSQQYHIAYEEALKLVQAQAQIAGKSVTVARVNVAEDRNDIQTQKHNVALQQRQEQIAAAQAAQRAEERYQGVLGNYAPQLSHARAELAQLTKGSEAYINKEIEIAQLQKSQESADKKGRGGAGKLSDQQKLNNSLLADEDKFNTQYEDADLKHAQNLLKIQADYAEKMRAAQESFDQDQLDGRASFYDNLASIESGKIQKQASAAYEAASQEAGRIAQEKGADVADKYMSAQEQIISARAKRLSDIEKAEKDKDKDKAAYLKGVDELHKQAEDAKLNRIKEGAGSLASERDKQIQDENQQYEESQGKIAESADRAADRKIAAAERSGKAIDVEQLKLDKLGTTYDRLAPVRGQPSTGPGASGQAAGPAAPAAAPDQAPAADPIASAIADAKGAIVDALAAIERAARDTTSAVKALPRSGGIAA